MGHIQHYCLSFFTAKIWWFAKFKHDPIWQDHMKSEHLGEKPYVCQVCNMRFVNQFRLKRPQDNHNAPASFICQICSKGFTADRQLKVHMRVHSDERPFECKPCDLTFKRKDRLNRHLKTASHKLIAEKMDDDNFSIEIC